MFRLRQYEPADQPAVWDLHEQALRHAGAYAGHGPWDEDVRSIDAVYLIPGGEFLVGVLDGTVIAMGGFTPLDAGVAEIKRMRVNPTHQRRGYGRAVLLALEDRARELRYREIRLDTSVVQHAAIALYLAHGYQVADRFNRNGFDLLLFRKCLT